MAFSTTFLPRDPQRPPAVKLRKFRQNNRVWLDPDQAAATNRFRRECPLHYYLARYDAAALLASLKLGENPGKRDAAGRTVLDLALQMASSLIETSLCTSIPLDTVYSPAHGTSLASYRIPPNMIGQTFTNPFVLKLPNACANLYDQSNNMRYQAAGIKAFHSSQRSPFEVSFKRTPSDEFDHCVSRANLSCSNAQQSEVAFNFESASRSSQLKQAPVFPFPQEEPTHRRMRGSRSQQFSYGYDETGRPQPLSELEKDQARLEQHYVKQEFLLIMNAYLQRPPNKTALTQMRELVKRLKILLMVIQKVNSCNLLKRESAQKAKSYFASCLNYPYLYIAALHQAFKTYSKAIDGQRWDVLNPADGRRLILTILSLKLRGYELFSFLSTVCQIIGLLMDAVEVYVGDQKDSLLGWWSINGECTQYYLHMAFALDQLNLFQKLVVLPVIFERRDVFKWEDLLYTMMQRRKQYYPYFAALLARRLKSRVQKRFVDDPTATDQYIPESVKYPCEERYFTRELLGEYSDIFGAAETEEFSALLRHWRYGAARPYISPRTNSKSIRFLPPTHAQDDKLA